MKVISVNKNKTTKVGISVPFIESNVFKMTTSNREQVKSNLINFILTEKGESLYNLSFGTNLRKNLYEPFTNTENLKNELLNDISKYFNGKINIIQLDISTDKSNSLVGIYLEYSVVSETDSDVIALTFT